MIVIHLVVPKTDHEQLVCNTYIVCAHVNYRMAQIFDGGKF